MPGHPHCAAPGFTVVGLTGGIASGKSTVSNMLRDLGVAVIDADVVAREVVEPGTPGLEAVLDAFGAHLARPDGSLDRKALGAIVFADGEALEQLEAIVHPRIAARAAQLIAKARESGEPFVVYDAALLVEWGISDSFEPLVVVAVPAEVQIERITARDGLSVAEAQQRLDAQLPLEDKVAAADVVIDNAGSLEETRAQVEALVARLRAPDSDSKEAS